MTRVAGRRSHPPTLLTHIKRAIVDHQLVRPGETVLVACSGGPDSMALLSGLQHWSKPHGFNLVVATVDHGLRAEVDSEIALVQELALRFGLRWNLIRLTLPAGSNLQARARNARLQALAQAAIAAGASCIATGHTADDRAETLLIRMVRGTGTSGLAVLPPVAPLPLAEPTKETVDLRLVRPLFRCRRADVLAHLTRHQLAFATDPSNSNPRFLRARIRSQVVPALEALNPRVIEALCRLADEAIGSKNR